MWYPVYSFEPSVPFEAAVVVDGQSYFYSRGGQRLASYVQPARYERTNMRMTAVTNVSLRAGPASLPDHLLRK